jgi:hypothetical protein
MTKKKGMIPVKGYFERAKVFGYLVIAMLVFAILYYLYRAFSGQ